MLAGIFAGGDSSNRGKQEMGAGEPNTDVGFTNPVTISAPAVSASGGSATLTWTTNIAASTWLKWGLAPNLDQDAGEKDKNPLVTSHSVTINSLTPGKTYLYQMISRQNSGKDGMNNTVMDGYQAIYNGSFGAA